MRSERPVRPRARIPFATALLLVGCGSVFGLDDYEVTDDERCGDELVDLSSNPDHCGSCDTVCGSDESCVSGSCACDDADLDVCSGRCVDVTVDEAHCGRCGNACPPGATCTDGDCACPSGEELCGAECVELGDCSCMAPDGNGECSPSGCGCGASEGCYYGSSTGWTCITAGRVGDGGACASSDDCAANLSCVSNVCRSYCGQGQPCAGDCSPVFVNDEPVNEWNYCHPVCNPIPTSSLSSDPPCGTGQRCTLLFAGSSICSPVNANAGTHGSRCETNEDCESGTFCNAAGHCTASCWVDNDTCSLFAPGLGCRTYVDPILVDGNEVGACLPTQAAAGCKAPCDTDADCTITGTRCVETTSGAICLNEQCTDCFNDDLSCNSDNDTCAFLECAP
jgi:hypothetical protein